MIGRPPRRQPLFPFDSARQPYRRSWSDCTFDWVLTSRGITVAKSSAARQVSSKPQQEGSTRASNTAPASGIATSLDRLLRDRMRLGIVSALAAADDVVVFRRVEVRIECDGWHHSRDSQQLISSPSSDPSLSPRHRELFVIK